jgi:hypothetical protein
MNNKFTLFLVALTVVATGIFASVDADAAKRKVVLEDHTGAWCGWCTRGMETLEELENEFGDMIIGVGVHNGDNMSVATYQGPLAKQIGLQGYPNGSVNRVVNGGRIAQSDNAWRPMALTQVNTDVPVGVSLEVDYDASTGAYTASITADVESTVNDQLAWNLWVLEDYVTGSGNGWDQANYLSGRKGYEDSKFYEQPNPIPSFQHMDVFRKAHGGVLGDTDGFPMPAAADTYTKKYTGNIDGLNIQNNENVFFVAVVHNTKNQEIINADRVGKVVKEKNRVAAEADNMYTSISDNEDNEVTVTVTNENDWAINTNLSIDTEASLIPEGWNVEISNNTLNIPAMGSKTFTLTVNKNNIEGYAQVEVAIEPETTEDRIGVNTSITAYYMSEKIENAIVFGYDDGIAPTAQAIGMSSAVSNPVLVGGTADVISNFPQMENFKTMIVTSTEATLLMSSSSNRAMLSLINTVAANGGDILIAACYDVINYGGLLANGGITVSAEARSFFTNTLGVEFGNAIQILNQQGQLARLTLNGVSGDPISDGMTIANYNAVYNQTSYPFYAQYFSSFKMASGSNGKAFLTVDPSISNSINKENNVCGVRVDNNGQRIVFMTFALDPMPSASLVDLVDKSLTWLTAEAAAGPSVSLNVSSVNFGTVETGKSATEAVRVTNNGNADLIISEVTFKTGEMFSVEGSFPITIEAGASQNMLVNFEPTKDGEFTDEMMCTTNDPDNATVTVPLSGKTATTSVNGIISGLFEMKMVPNPVVDDSKIELQVNQSANVSLELIDATGKSLGNLFNGVTMSESLDFNSSELTSGTYYINAIVDGKTTQLPVVITK